MIEAALAQGPVTVLTNGLLFKPETAQRLRALFDASPYSLDLRVSIDGYDAASNDPIRGAGSFERILGGHSQARRSRPQPGAHGDRGLRGRRHRGGPARAGSPSCVRSASPSRGSR